LTISAATQYCVIGMTTSLLTANEMNSQLLSVFI